MTPSVERDFASLVDQLVESVNAAGAEIRARREAAPPLDATTTRAIIDAYVAELRTRGWLTEVDPEQLEDILQIVVLADADGGRSLDIESDVTASVYDVPGWGVSETDPVKIGRGLGQDEAELLEAMRDSGEATGWE
jgi:hypothetical protein